MIIARPKTILASDFLLLRDGHILARSSSTWLAIGGVFKYFMGEEEFIVTPSWDPYAFLKRLKSIEIAKQGIEWLHVDMQYQSIVRGRLIFRCGNLEYELRHGYSLCYQVFLNGKQCGAIHIKGVDEFGNVQGRYLFSRQWLIDLSESIPNEIQAALFMLSRYFN